MREIKFRAWHKADKRMYYEIAIAPPKKEIIIFNYAKLKDLTGDYFSFSEVEIMQFTCLKDKNGVEIYEGDIVEHKSKYPHVAGKFEIIYNSEKKDFAAFCLIRINKNEWKINLEGKLSGWEGVLGSQGHLSKDLEVIGNIYENPELLKENVNSQR